MQNSDDQAERLRILDGLLCSSDPKVVRDLLETTLVNSGEVNYRQHVLYRIVDNTFARSSVGLTVMVDFISYFYDDFITK